MSVLGHAQLVSYCDIHVAGRDSFEYGIAKIPRVENHSRTHLVSIRPGSADVGNQATNGARGGFGQTVVDFEDIVVGYSC